MTEHRITAGFMPLLDSLLLVIAREKGFAAAEGIDLSLVRETSWANIRDRTAVGHFDVAHMLAPMPIAASLGLAPISTPVVALMALGLGGNAPISTPVVALMALGLGGNAVTVRKALWQAMAVAGAPPDSLDAAAAGAALATVIGEAGERLKFAVVHPHSGHNYELRYWLTASGIRPDRDIEIVILPPPLMPDALASGGIDGYCVGEPWNSAGVASGAGRIVTVKSRIWQASPEKVLGATERWAAHNPEAAAALVRALYRAAQWCSFPGNHAETAAILAAPAYLDRPAELMLHALTGDIDVERGKTIEVPDFFIPEAQSANFPWVSHALWFYSQMVRWGDVEHSADNARRAAACYRPDLYRSAIAPFGASLPTTDARALPADAFFDGRVFDPDSLDQYIAEQRERT